jgi:ribulose-5-phosphate 4-epimerase/fuculose-1-phosphate aldolase
MIGDSFEKDILGARRCGIPGILVNEKAEHSFANLSFKRIQELYLWLRELNLETLHLMRMSRYCGERFDLTQAAGGNSSVKVGGLMLIKSSGFGLSEIDLKYGYTIVDNDRLARDLANGSVLSLEKYSVFSIRRASIETYMHSVLNKYTLHLHPLQVNQILTSVNGKERIAAIFPEALVLDYVAPGLGIAEMLTDWRGNQLIFLMNHGVIITASTEEQVIVLLESMLEKCAAHFNVDHFRYREVNRLTTLLNKVTGLEFLSYLCDDAVIRKHFMKLQDIYPTFPDSVVYCGLEVLFLTKIAEKEVLEFVERCGTPKLVVFEDELFIFDSSIKKCHDTESVLKSALLLRSSQGTCVRLSESDVSFLNNWESEKYRKLLKN